MIEDFPTLVGAVLSYAHSPELQTEVEEFFVPLTNKRLGRELRDATNLVATTLEPTVNPFAAPEDLAEIFSIEWQNARGPTSLTSRGAHGINRIGTTGSPPVAYQLAGGLFDVRPFAAGKFDLLYYAAPVLDAENPVNDVIQDHPELYLYGALTELHIWQQDMDLATTTSQSFLGEIAAVNRAYQRRRYDAPAVIGV